MSERDTHFRGFARCVRKKIEDKIEDMSPDILEVRLSIPYPEDVRREIEMLIAQGAYDLVRFIFESESVQDLLDPWEVFNQRTDFKGSLLPHIPDMKERPEKTD